MEDKLFEFYKFFRRVNSKKRKMNRVMAIVERLYCQSSTPKKTERAIELWYFGHFVLKKGIFVIQKIYLVTSWPKAAGVIIRGANPETTKVLTCEEPRILFEVKN